MWISGQNSVDKYVENLWITYFLTKNDVDFQKHPVDNF